MSSLLLATVDYGSVLYNQYGALALGWVVSFALSGYVIFLHNRINSIWKTHYGFAAKVLDDMKPYLNKQTETLIELVKLETDNHSKIEDVDDRQIFLMGKLGVIIDEYQKAQSGKRNQERLETQDKLDKSNA